MSLTTLKRYLYERDPEFGRLMSMIFSGVAASAVRRDGEEHAGLRAELTAIELELGDDFTVQHSLAAVESAMRSLEQYNHRTAKFIRQQEVELQKMIKMLAQAVLSISGSSEVSSRMLGEIQDSLLQATGLDDLHNVKAQLQVCLEQVCRESARQKEEAQASIVELQGHLAHPDTAVQAPQEIDPVTKLPSRSAAEAALREACQAPGRKYLGVLVLDRLKSINSRFGNAVGDQVLEELTRHIELHLSPTDSLFRWSGPTLLAVLRRQCSIDRIRAEVKPFFNKCIEKEFNVGGRNVFIPISPAWAVFAMVPPLSMVVQHVDAFVSSQSPKDYV